MSGDEQDGYPTTNAGKSGLDLEKMLQAAREEMSRRFTLVTASKEEMSRWVVLADGGTDEVQLFLVEDECGGMVNDAALDERRQEMMRRMREL